MRNEVLHFSASVPAPGRCSGEWTWAREPCHSTSAAGVTVILAAQESPNRLQLGHWLGYSGSAPLELPPSVVTWARAVPPAAPAPPRASAWLAWWRRGPRSCA